MSFNEGVSGEESHTLGIGNITSFGTHRARISTVDDLVTFAIDENYSGTFVPTISATIDLALPVYATIKAALMNEARPFFGTANTGLLYDDMSVSVASIPEAGAWLIMSPVLAVSACAATIRRRRRVG